MKLGCYMIVKNEEECLGACLASLVGLDEIIILDTGSTDKTEEVASKYPCTYIKNVYRWKDDFADARNASLKWATADWLIVIDADEILKGDIDKIRDTINNNPKFNSYKVPTISIRTGQEHPSVRLHKRDDDIKWHAPAHNYLSVRGDAPIACMEVHYGYSPAHAKDPDRTLRILTKCVKDNPECIREKYYLAREYYDRKDHRVAITYWEWYLETSKKGPEIADAWLYLARCYAYIKNSNKAKDCCLQAIKMNGNFREAWRFLASLSGPGNMKRFNEIADTSSNEGLLFIRGK